MSDKIVNSIFLFTDQQRMLYEQEDKCFQGLDKIESLQSHQNHEIYQKAYDMIENYFSADDEDVGLLPNVILLNYYSKY